MEKLNGAQIVVKVLCDMGVTDVFGYTGASVMPVFDVILDSPIHFYMTACETGACHAADGYSRASGRTGVVMSTSGPGATNLVTGIATAYMDSTALVAISANVSQNKLGKDSFQEVDITGVVTPVTKYTRIIHHVEELEYELKKAFALAGSGRKGPVLIDIPHNIMYDTAEYKNLTVEPPKPVYNMSGIDLSVTLIEQSRRPIILVGGGAQGAGKAVNALADRLQCPIVSSLRGIGVTDHPNYIGAVGSSACKYNNDLYQKADTVIALGTRFSDKMYNVKPKKKTFIHVDFDRAELNKVIYAEATVHSDISAAIEAMLPSITERPAHKTPYRIVYDKDTPIKKFAAMLATLPLEGTILATDVGNHQVAVLNAIRHKNHREIVSSLGLGTMGFGLGASIGAAIATKKPVLLITGDGSFNMEYTELVTAVRYNLPIKAVVVNNGKLGMIVDLANKIYNGRLIAAVPPKIDYPALARSVGATGKSMTLRSAKKYLMEEQHGVTLYDLKI